MMKRILILCQANDSGAMQVAKVIGSQLGQKVVLVIHPEIFALTQWSHHIDRFGRATTCLRLPNQDDFNSESIGCLFNRLRYVPNMLFTSQKNRDYAGAELQALISSWIVALGMHVVNPISIVSGIASPISQPQWLSTARQCGLPISRYVTATASKLIGKILPGEVLHPLTDWPGKPGVIPAEIALDNSTRIPKETVLVCGNRVFGSLTEMFGISCLRLAQKMRYNLLEIQFGLIEGQFRVVAVSPYPLLESRWAVDETAEMVMDLALAGGCSV